MVRIVQEAWAFHGIQRRVEEGLLRVPCSGHNDGMGDLAMLSEITGLLREIGIHPSGATIDIQGGEITDTHTDVLTPQRRRRADADVLHLSGCSTFVPAGTWSANC